MRLTRLAVIAVVALAALGAAGQVAAQNEDAYRATVDAPDTVKAGEDFDVTLTVDIVDSPAQVTVQTTVKMLVDGEVVDTRNFQLDVENGKSISKTSTISLDEPGKHEITYTIEGRYIGQTVVGGNPESKPSLRKEVTAVSNVSVRVGDVAPGEPANVSLDRSSADIQLSELELGATEEVDDVFVQITPTGEPPEGVDEGPEGTERYFVIEPANANASVFTNVWTTVLVDHEAFLPGAEVGVYRWDGEEWRSVRVTSTSTGNGTAYRGTMPSLSPIAVTVTGGEEPEEDDEAPADTEDGGDGGQGLPGFTALAAIAAALTAAAAGRRFRR